MCCLLTCCGWIVDGVQRCWSFTMACVIAGSVCCTLVVAMGAGVALGYNYSLSEYVELKETNVSVFMKRGVFDDAIVDEMDWRRGGGGPANIEQEAEESANGLARRQGDFQNYRRTDDGLLATESPEPTNQLYSLESDEHLKYEGALLKLTATTPNALLVPTTEDPILAKMLRSGTQANFEQLNALQNLMNRRNMIESTAIWNFPKPIEVGTPRTTLSDADQLKELQDLLDKKKMIALKLASLAKTVTASTYDVKLDPSARRMGGLPDPRAAQEQEMKELLNPEPPKWYTPRVKESNGLGPLQGPPVPKIIIDSPEVQKVNPFIKTASSLMSQDEFRRAMQDSQELLPPTKPQRTTEIYSNEETVQTDKPFHPPFTSKSSIKEDSGSQAEDTDLDAAIKMDKEYDEDEIKGAPVRRRRKRNKRFLDKLNLKLDDTNDNITLKEDKFLNNHDQLLTIETRGINSHVSNSKHNYDIDMMSSEPKSPEMATTAYKPTYIGSESTETSTKSTNTSSQKSVSLISKLKPKGSDLNVSVETEVFPKLDKVVQNDKTETTRRPHDKPSILWRRLILNLICLQP